jgi:hypothetical protein
MILLLYAAIVSEPPKWREAADQMVGMWSYGDGWNVEEWRHPDGESTCSVTTETLKVGRESYTARLSFGTRTEIVFATNLDVKMVESFAIDFDDGAGLDMSDTEITKVDKGTFVSNSMSNAMFKLVIDDMRLTKQASITLNGGVYPLPMNDFATVYSDLKKCENSRLGIVLGD